MPAALEAERSQSASRSKAKSGTTSTGSPRDSSRPLTANFLRRVTKPRKKSSGCTRLLIRCSESRWVNSFGKERLLGRTEDKRSGYRTANRHHAKPGERPDMIVDTETSAAWMTEFGRQ